MVHDSLLVQGENEDSVNVAPATPVGVGITIHDKGDTRRGGEMYLPTMKVRASLRMKGMSE